MFTVYAATKSYVLSFSRGLREELKARGIVVTAVCPGPVSYTHLDCISFGPNMIDVHSYNERLEIASAERIWKALKEILKRCK